MRIRRPRVDRIGAHRGYYYWYKISKKGLDRAQYFSNRRSIPSFNTVAFGRGTLQDLVKLHLSKDLDNKLPNPSDAVLRRGIECFQDILDVYRPYAIIASVFPGFTYKEMMMCEALGKGGGRVMGTLIYLRNQGLIPEDYGIDGEVYMARKDGWSDMEILLLMLLKSLKTELSNLKELNEKNQKLESELDKMHQLLALVPQMLENALNMARN